MNETGLESAASDAAYARLLGQHLPEPTLAVTETMRVLRPGAPFVIYDADDEVILLIDPPVPGLVASWIG